MDKFENTQANNEKDENKQYYIPMEVTAETIKDFGIDPADVVWTKIGNRKKRVVMIAATEEQYKAYMRPDRKSTRLNSSHMSESRMPSSA